MTFFGTRGLDSVIGVRKDTNSNSPTTGWRIDHIKFNFSGSLTSRPISIMGYNYGLIDHNIFIGGNYQAILVSPGESGEAISGDNSWSRPVIFGSADAVFEEDNIFSMTGCLADVDSNNGARVVFRYNNATNFFFETHGTGHSTNRAGLHHEVYENKFSGTGGCTNIGASLFGGTGVIFNNALVTPGVFSVGNYRSCCGEPGNKPCKGSGGLDTRCDGTSSVDENLPGMMGYKCADQIGTIGPLNNQISVPVYTWNNDIDTVLQGSLSNCSNPTQSDHIQEGRDFFNNISKPGYVPYVYPHPLVQIETDLQQPATCLVADLNCNGSIDLQDLIILKNLWGQTNSKADLNQDSLINTQDLGIMMSIWGSY